MDDPEITPEVEVTVCVVTYNHGKYITQCIDSLLAQETTFSYEIIISDDCSTDNTWPIISQYSSKYPKKIKAYRQDVNIGPFKNYLFVHRLANGKYIAHVDGDDYVLLGKLQKQFDVLEGNPDCNIVLHAVDVLQPTGKFRASKQINKNLPLQYFTQADLINFTWIGAHSSKMYRQTPGSKYLEQERFIDFFLIFQEVGSGFGYFASDKSYGVYREGVGLATQGSLVRNLLIEHLAFIYKTHPHYRHYVCSAFIYMVISDIKNKSATLKLTMLWFVKTLTIQGVFIFIKTLKKRLSIAM